MAGKRQQRERRARVLDRAGEVGDDAAAAEAGVTVATLRRWRDAESEQSPAVPDSAPAPEPEPDVEPPRPLDDLDRMRQAANAARIVAIRAIRKTNDLLDASRASDARNAAAAGGIWADKAARWDELVAQAEQRQVELAEQQAQLLVERVRLLFERLGLPIDQGEVRQVVASTLRGENVARADADRARTAIRAHLGVPSRRQPLALPAPVPPNPDGDERTREERADLDRREPLAAPKRVVRAVRGRARREKPLKVEAEVVVEKSSRPRGHAAIEKVAVQVGERVDVLEFDADGELVNPNAPNWRPR